MGKTGAFLINRDHARLWTGQAVSTVGDIVFDTTLVLWIAARLGQGKPWAPAAVGGVLLCAGLAILVIGPAAGVFVDRWNRRRTMLKTEVLRALLVGTLAAVSFLPLSALPTGVWLALIYTTVFGVNAIGQFFGPARFATITAIVAGEADRTRASALGQINYAAASILGPPLAAPLLFAVGVQWALIVNAASYVFSFFVIRSIRTPDDSGGPHTSYKNLTREFAEGARFLRTSRVLTALLVMIVISGLCTGPISTLEVFFVTDNLHTRASLYGLMGMMFGLGFIVGAVLTGPGARRAGMGGVTSWGFLVTAVVFAWYARQTEFAAGLGFYFVLAIPVGMLNTAINPMVMAATPPEYIGRVQAAINPAQQLASIVSTLVCSWLASTALHGFHAKVAGIHIAGIDTIFTGAGLLLFAAGLYGLRALPRDAGSQLPVPADSPQHTAT